METFTPGEHKMYYPRRGKPGHLVTIVAVRPHPFYGRKIVFRYADGRQKEVAAQRFYTSPE
jgi:hypothetical protein